MCMLAPHACSCLSRQQRSGCQPGPAATHACPLPAPCLPLARHAANDATAYTPAVDIGDLVSLEAVQVRIEPRFSHPNRRPWVVADALGPHRAAVARLPLFNELLPFSSAAHPTQPPTPPAHPAGGAGAGPQWRPGLLPRLPGAKHGLAAPATGAAGARCGSCAAWHAARHVVLPLVWILELHRSLNGVRTLGPTVTECVVGLHPSLPHAEGCYLLFDLPGQVGLGWGWIVASLDKSAGCAPPGFCPCHMRAAVFTGNATLRGELSTLHGSLQSIVPLLS